MAQFHEVLDIGGGKYKVIFKVQKADVDGTLHWMPVNVQEFTMAELDAKIAYHTAQETNHTYCITKLNNIKTIIRGM